MNDLELAEEIERRLEAIPEDYFWSISFPFEEWEQIIAALRRGHERQPDEWQLVPKQWTSGMAHAGYEVHRDERIQCAECGEIYVAMLKVAPTLGGSAKTENGSGSLELKRPPSGEMVMVPREPTKGIIQAMNETYWKLAERAKLTQGGNVYVDEYATAIYHAMLSAAEAEVRKPYAHIMGACPLCGRTDSHSHTSGPLGMS